MSGFPVMRGACDASAAATISAIMGLGWALRASPRGDAVKAEAVDATRVFRDAAAPAGLRSGADDGRGPGAAGDARSAWLRGSLDRRALHRAVGKHSVPGPLHRARPGPHEADEAGDRRVVPAQPPSADACPAYRAARSDGAPPPPLGRPVRR